jgi:hypothetical protein
VCVCGAGLKEAFINDFLSNDVDGAALVDIDGEDLAGTSVFVAACTTSICVENLSRALFRHGH